MSERLLQGYALLIGVTENQVNGLALPAVARDVQALRAVLTHPERCAYPPDQVAALTSAAASRQGILDALASIAGQVRAAEQEAGHGATVVIYFSGHGWRDTHQDPPDFFLIPYDLQPGMYRETALRAADFAAAIDTMRPRRLLVILDCCHAGGMEVKDLGLEGAAGFTESALATGLMMRGLSMAPAAAGDPGGAKSLSGLERGEGRAILSSSKGEQKSYLRRDGAMSIFTYHLIEALTGHAQPRYGAADVLVSDVMSYVSRSVPASAEAEYHADQEPDYQVSGSFPVALLLGGKGLSEGEPPPDPLQPLPAIHISTGGGDITGGHKIVGTISNVSGGYSAIGVGISQVDIAITDAGQNPLPALFARLARDLDTAGLPPDQREVAHYALEQLRSALEPPNQPLSAPALHMSVDSLLQYAPALVDGLRALFAEPGLRARLEQSAPGAASWLQTRLAGG